MNGSTYVGVTHSGPPSAPAANLSIYKLHKDLNVTLVRRTLFLVGVSVTASVLNDFICLGPNFRHRIAGCETRHRWRSTVPYSIKPGETERSSFLCFSISRYITSYGVILVCSVLQIFVWTRGSFSLLQTLDFGGDVLSVAPVTRGVVPHLLVCVDGQNVSCVLLRWTNRRFQTPQPLKLPGRVLQAELINTRADETLLLVGIEGDVLSSS